MVGLVTRDTQQEWDEDMLEQWTPAHESGPPNARRTSLCRHLDVYRAADSIRSPSEFIICFLSLSARVSHFLQSTLALTFSPHSCGIHLPLTLDIFFLAAYAM